jgi:hypothetical protein
MTTTTTTTTRSVAAAAAIAAIALRLVSIFSWPPDSDASHAKMLAAAGAHPTAWNLATWTEVLCWTSAGFAVLTALWLVAGKGFWLTRIGGWLYGASLITLGVMGGAMNAVTGVLAKEPHAAAMTRVIDHLHSAGSLAPFVALVLLGELFAIPFALGLWRAGLVGWWFPAVTLVAIVGYVATSDSSNHVVVLAGFVPLGLTWLGLAGMLRHERTAQTTSAPSVGVTAGVGAGALS